jgi:hypothetical protein
MSTTFAATLPHPVNHAHASRRRGFEIVSRLARQNEAPGRRTATRSDPNEWATDTRTDYEPRHRREDSALFLLHLAVS